MTAIFRNITMPVHYKYPLPSLLEGIATVSQYDKWLNNKADTLRRHDLKMKRPFARECSKAVYKQKIHEAIMNSDGKDPFTGDVLRWDLVEEWKSKGKGKTAGNKISRSGAFDKEFFLKPVVDHCNPYGDTPEFEICSWIVNESKSIMTPEEYVALCGKVAGNRMRIGK
jgi:hypothetical protein